MAYACLMAPAISEIDVGGPGEWWLDSWQLDCVYIDTIMWLVLTVM